MATTNNSPFRTLNDDVLRRLLSGVPLDDHDATAAACRAFHDVIRSPQFSALRRRYGLAETSSDDWSPLDLDIAPPQQLYDDPPDAVMCSGFASVVGGSVLL
jgi:hypothetical protein